MLSPNPPFSLSITVSNASPYFDEPNEGEEDRDPAIRALRRCRPGDGGQPPLRLVPSEEEEETLRHSLCVVDEDDRNIDDDGKADAAAETEGDDDDDNEEEGVDDCAQPTPDRFVPSEFARCTLRASEGAEELVALFFVRHSDNRGDVMEASCLCAESTNSVRDPEKCDDETASFNRFLLVELDGDDTEDWDEDEEEEDEDNNDDDEDEDDVVGEDNGEGDDNFDDDVTAEIGEGLPRPEDDDEEDEDDIEKVGAEECCENSLMRDAVLRFGVTAAYFPPPLVPDGLGCWRTADSVGESAPFSH